MTKPANANMFDKINMISYFLQLVRLYSRTKSDSWIVSYRATVVENYGKIWLGIQSSVLTYGDAPEPESEAAEGEIATGGSCLPDGLEALPAVDTMPGVAILCGNFTQCPCGWRCCQQCSLDEDGLELCAGYAICRKPMEKESAEDADEA